MTAYEQLMQREEGNIKMLSISKAPEGQLQVAYSQSDSPHTHIAIAKSIEEACQQILDSKREVELSGKTGQLKPGDKIVTGEVPDLQENFHSSLEARLLDAEDQIREQELEIAYLTGIIDALQGEA